MDRPFRPDLNRALKNIIVYGSDEQRLSSLKEAARTAREFAQRHRQDAGGQTVSTDMDDERRIALHAIELTEKSQACFDEQTQSAALYPRFERLAETLEADAQKIDQKLNAALWGDGSF
ncbi:MAG: hypothetical protein LBL31_01595 [Spirochaetaceae bacterium]|jgi:hypothetical protein|nr:hypothetical protein [Spirochaetaceae bacterium]